MRLGLVRSDLVVVSACEARQRRRESVSNAMHGIHVADVLYVERGWMEF